MAAERLSQLQRRLLAWLLAEEQRTRGTMSASHQDLVRALGHDKGNLSTSLKINLGVFSSSTKKRGHDKGNLSTSLKGLETKGLVTITRTPGGQAEAVDLTAAGRNRVAALTASCD